MRTRKYIPISENKIDRFLRFNSLPATTHRDNGVQNLLLSPINVYGLFIIPMFWVDYAYFNCFNTRLRQIYFRYVGKHGTKSLASLSRRIIAQIPLFL